MKILFILLDDEAYISHFPIGIASMTAVLEKEGHQVDFYHEDLYHYPKWHLTEYLNEHSFDLIGLSFVAGYFPYRNVIKIADAINKSKSRAFFCLGGHGPTPEPEYFITLTNADAVCMGEGEATIKELVNALANGTSLASVKGIAWREGTIVHINESRPLIEDLDGLPPIPYDRFPMQIYRLARHPGIAPTEFSASVLSGRGCPFNCNFCYRLTKGIRLRSDEAIVDEIRRLKRDFAIKYISFSDELVVTSVERATSLCESFLRGKLDIKWSAPGRLNYAKPELLNLMKRSGCQYIGYGIESVDNNVLKKMNKALTYDQIVSGVEATLEAGITPGLFLMFGNKGDNLTTLEKSVNFIKKYNNGSEARTLRPVTPYPGCPLYYEALDLGLIKDCSDFYENKLINSELPSVNFSELSDQELISALKKANAVLLQDYRDKLGEYHKQCLNDIYISQNPAFRGFRHT